MTMSNSHIRDGQVIRNAKVDFFDFDQQGGYAVPQQPFEIQPGDSFKTSCQYLSEDTVFGLSSQQEMCIAFLTYYPRQFIPYSGFEAPFMCGYDLPFPDCASDWEKTPLESDSDLSRTFGTPSDVCGGSGGDGGGAASGASGGKCLASAVGLSLVATLLGDF